MKKFLIVVVFLAIYINSLHSGGSGSYWSVYFDSDTFDVKLARFIGNAQSSLDICFYEIFRDTVARAILSAKRRGVSVRVITDSSYFYRPYIDSMRAAGIPVIHEGIGPNSTNHIMHNKFIVRDYRDNDTANDYVWTGSYNASNYTRLNAENAIVINSHSVATAYFYEFNLMWGSSTETPDSLNSRTGTRKKGYGCSQHLFIIEGDSIWVYFSPQDSSIRYINYFVGLAQDSIGYLIFSFTRRDLADSMIGAFTRGVWIGGVHDRSDTGSSYSQYLYLKNAGLLIYSDRLPSNYDLLHHKFMVIDKAYVITGSMNWSNNGNNENDENTIIIKNSQIANLYWQEFLRRWSEALGIEENTTTTNFSIILGNSGVKFTFSGFLVYSTDGKLINESIGNYWDGRDYNGNNVRNGIYFVIPKNFSNKVHKVIKLN